MCWLRRALISFSALATFAGAVPGQSLPILLEEDFENGMRRWLCTDHDLKESVWKIEELSVADGANKVLRVTGKSTYEPPHRSPHSVAWLKDVDVGSLQIDVRVQNTRPGERRAHRPRYPSHPISLVNRYALLHVAP